MKKSYFLWPLLLQKLIWVPTRILLMVFGRLAIKGIENLKGIKGNAIFACNHASEFDVFLVPGALGFFSKFSPIFYTSREKTFYTRAGWRQRFYGGRFFRIWGGYPAYVGLNDYEKSLVHHVKILNDGGNLCVFPEGRTTQDGRMGEAKGGVAYLSMVTGRPIVPVYLGGTYRLAPGELLSGKRKLTISFGEPVHVTLPSDASIHEYKLRANLVMDKIRGMSEREEKVVGSPVPVPKTA